MTRKTNILYIILAIVFGVALRTVIGYYEKGLRVVRQASTSGTVVETGKLVVNLIFDYIFVMTAMFAGMLSYAFYAFCIAPIVPALPDPIQIFGMVGTSFTVNEILNKSIGH